MIPANDLRKHVTARVHEAYWGNDDNCARTTLMILCEQAHAAVPDVLWDAAVGMHGAGDYGAQCGLVEGMLLFLGFWGKQCGMPEAEIVSLCHAYATQFEDRFGNLRCAVLRPQGFSPGLAGEHVCEKLTVEAILFDFAFLARVNLLPR